MFSNFRFSYSSSTNGQEEENPSLGVDMTMNTFIFSRGLKQWVWNRETQAFDVVGLDRLLQEVEFLEKRKAYS